MDTMVMKMIGCNQNKKLEFSSASLRNWNDGMVEYWNNGFWNIGRVEDWIFLKTRLRLRLRLRNKKYEKRDSSFKKTPTRGGTSFPQP